MALATLFIIPQTPDELQQWSFAHMASHRDICRVVFQTLSTRLDEYVLDPFDPLDPGNWVDRHQIMHQQMNAALGLDGFDLSELDWQDAERLQDWVVKNGNEHYRASSILRLG